ncbi:TetR family transcriptional regulator [Ralstonia syzygii]|nr:TetR family transcriptional regulator [Ralstonia syzygii]
MGFARTTAAEVAARAWVSTRSIYAVFFDKTELFCRAGDCDDLPIAC